VNAQIREIRSRLRACAELHIVSPSRIDSAIRLANCLPGFPAIRRFVACAQAVRPLALLAQGTPSSAAVSSVDSAAVGDNPDRGDRGLIFIAPFLPAETSSVCAAIRLTRDVFDTYGFVPYITTNILDSRVVELVINVSFDRQSADSVDRAHQCRADLTDRLFAEGFSPYRLDIESMHHMRRARPEHQHLIKSLKHTLDPHAILAPGRYES
jgi:hypothetical protein